MNKVLKIVLQLIKVVVHCILRIHCNASDDCNTSTSNDDENFDVTKEEKK